MTNTPKNKRGRPSVYKPEFVEKAYKLALLGLTNDQIAAALDISTTSLDSFIANKDDFSCALKAGRIEADANVGKALYQRACGYSHPEEVIRVMNDGEIIRVQTIKHYPPDTAAAMIWLHNRQRGLWMPKPPDNAPIDWSEGVEGPDGELL